MAAERSAVDIAVLKVEMKQVTQKIDKLEATIEALPERLIIALDERYAKRSDVEEIKETVAPLTKFRRKLWTAVIMGMLSLVVAAIILAEAYKLKGH